MKTFQLTLKLATPFFCKERLTLDALLSAAVFNATGLMGEETAAHIPLAREDGIFKGSSYFCPNTYRHVNVGRVMSLKSERDLSPELFKPQMRGDKYGHVDQKRGEYKSNLDSYPGFSAKEIYFWGVGDPEKTANLIRNFIPGIGKRCNAGAGEIVDVLVFETDDDYSWKTERGDPARPLPVAIWEKIGGRADIPTTPLAISFPSWGAPCVDVVFPMSLVA